MSTSGLTVAKIREATELLMKAEAVSPNPHEYVMLDTPATRKFLLALFGYIPGKNNGLRLIKGEKLPIK